jgi:hypothetical protein
MGKNYWKMHFPEHEILRAIKKDLLALIPFHAVVAFVCSNVT